MENEHVYLSNDVKLENIINASTDDIYIPCGIKKSKIKKSLVYFKKYKLENLKESFNNYIFTDEIKFLCKKNNGDPYTIIKNIENLNDYKIHSFIFLPFDISNLTIYNGYLYIDDISMMTDICYYSEIEETLLFFYRFFKKK
jgi:hypothetical protein